MSTKTVMKIGKIRVNRTDYGCGSSVPPELKFEWVEESNYCMLPDDEVSIDIEKEDAERLIEVLKEHFGI